MGVYNSDGSINVTVVTADGSQVYHNDGSINVVVSTGGYGVYDPPTGAFRVTLVSSPQNSIYAPDGSINVSVSPYVPGTVRVSGTFGPPPTGGQYYVWLFF